MELWPGEAKQQKIRLTEEIVKSIMNVLNYGEESASIAFENVEPQHWAENVYKPDIVRNSDKL